MAFGRFDGGEAFLFPVRSEAVVVEFLLEEVHFEYLKAKNVVFFSEVERFAVLD